MEKKTLIELAVKAGRKRQSPQTGYVHYCYEAPQGLRQDTIPFYENVCFVLALFRTRIADHVLEARSLLEKLLAFEVEGNFPVYLHEFPVCRNPKLGAKVIFVLKVLVKEFQNVMGSSLKEKISNILAQGILEWIPRELKTPEAYAEALIYGTIDYSEALSVWDPELHVYIGPGQMQERGEPAVTLFDLYMGQLFGSLSRRSLEDHPVHMKAALLFPPEVEKSSLPQLMHDQEVVRIWMWGGAEQLHSLFIDEKKSFLQWESKNRASFTLPEILPEETPLEAMEIAFFCNVHADTVLYVNGMRANTFQLEDKVEIVSKGIRVQLQFSIKSGEGRFFGHISRANRPTQRAFRESDPYATYDWQIALRTLSRTPQCTLQLQTS